jgi:hypothetical protein
MSVPFRCAGLPLVAAALVAFSLAAHAADTAQPKKGGNVLSLGGQGKPTGKLLTRNELRECLAQERRVKAMNEEMKALQAELDNDNAEIGRKGEELKQAIATVDRTSQEAIDLVKAKAAEQDQRVDAYNAKLPPFNAKVQTVEGERATFAKNCADRPYDEGDYFAIQRGK